MPIYVTTWGDPTGWKEATYVCNGEERKGFLSAVCYKDVSKLIVITLDSILTPKITENSNKDVVECLKKSTSDYEGSSKLPSDYGSWKRTVKDYVNCILGKVSLQADVIVLPAIGKFNNYEYGKVEGQGYIPTGFLRGYLTLELYKRLKDEKNNEVILDITHGVNYLGAITLNVLTRLVSFLSLKLSVINFIPTDQAKGVYTYVEVLSHSKQYFDYNSIEESKIIDKKKKTVVKSLKYNALLPLYYLCDENKIPEYKINMSINNNVMSVPNLKDLSSLKEDNIWGEIVYDYVCSKVKSKKWVSTKELSDLANEILRIEAQKTIVFNELNDVYNKGKNVLKEGEVETYFEIYNKYIKASEEESRTENIEEKRESKDKESEDKSKTERNFMAHGGLLKDSLLVKKENNIIYVSYDESKRELLKNILGVDIFSNS